MPAAFEIASPAAGAPAAPRGWAKAHAAFAVAGVLWTGAVYELGARGQAPATSLAEVEGPHQYQCVNYFKQCPHGLSEPANPEAHAGCNQCSGLLHNKCCISECWFDDNCDSLKDPRSVDWFKEHRGSTSGACGNPDLVQNAVDKYYQLYRFGAEDRCAEWAEGFVPDALRPRGEHWAFGWAFEGRTELANFCADQTRYARELAGDKFPDKIFKRLTAVSQAAIGPECKTVSSYKGINGAWGFHVLVLTPLDNRGEPTSSADAIARYRVRSFTEIPGPKDEPGELLALPALSSDPKRLFT